MENESLRVQNVEDAHAQAYVEDFGHSLENGKTPAKLQRVTSDMAQLQSEMNTMSESIQSYRSQSVTNETLDANVPDQESIEAEQQLHDAPDEEDSKKQGLFSRAVTRISSPFKKAEAFIQTAKYTYLQNQIDRQEIAVGEKEAALAREQQLLDQEQARMQEEVERQAAKEASREAFKQSIKDSGRSLKSNIQQGFRQVGDFARGVAAKGRAVPEAINRSVEDVKDGWNETKSFASDLVDRGREGVQNVSASASARRSPAPDNSEEVVIDLMSERLKEKHVERDTFNDLMQEVHGKDIGYNKLDPSLDNDRESLDQMAHLESNDYLSQGPDGFVLEKNTSYYQHMMDLHSEEMLADSNGQLDDQDYQDRAKMLYEIYLSEKSESQSTVELNDTLSESYDTNYTSKRLQVYLAKNPSLTGIDEGLTEATVEKDQTPSEDYNLSPDASDVHEADNYLTEDPIMESSNVRQQQDINKEFNDVELAHNGYIDLDQEGSNIIALHDVRNEKNGADAAVASGKPTVDDSSMVKDALRAEKSYKDKAIAKSKAPAVDIGDLDGPNGP